MNLITIFDGTVELADDIQAAELWNKTEIIILTCTGEVILYNIETNNAETLFETNPKRGIQYADGGFDPTAQSSIYTMDDIIVVVNDYKKHGFVLNRKESYLVHFSREDYHADISKYPIALFKRKDEPHMIYSTAWNKVQIVSLTTRQVLTADKSLIEENAEQRHIDFYNKHKESNKLFWPREYDYFFGELTISPNGKQFLSAGWVWGSFDGCNLFDIEDFISNHRIKDTAVGGWEHENRGICFVDDETVAVLYNPCIEDGAVKDAPYEIRMYHANGCGEKSIVKLQAPLNLDGASLCYRQAEQRFYVFSHKVGLAAISLTGDIVFHSPDFVPQQYNKTYHQFICHNKRQIGIYQMK